MFIVSQVFDHVTLQGYFHVPDKLILDIFSVFFSHDGLSDIKIGFCCY